MIKEIVLPKVSENVEEGDVVKVLVSVGDEIEIDQSIIELETDKALFEVPSSEKGKVAEINVKEGDTIKIGQVILKVETDKEERANSKEQIAKSKEEKTESKEQIAESKENISKSKEQITENKEPKLETEERLSGDGQVKTEIISRGEAAPASPSIRRFAREIGLDINEISGTGPGGRISEDDVKAHAKRLLTGRGETQQTYSIRALPDFSKWGEIERKPMSKIRQITADSMSYAWNTIPQVTQYDRANITDLEKFRKDYNEKNKDVGAHATMTSILVRIIST